MFKIEDQIEDNVFDEISFVIAKFNAIKTYTKEKWFLFAKLDELTTQAGYKLFRGDYRTYHLQVNGESCLYDVPPNQRGFLDQYRNERVRLICVGYVNQYAPRWFKVGVVPTKEKVDNVVHLSRDNVLDYNSKKKVWRTF